MDVLIRSYCEKDWDAIEAIHDAARKLELKFAGLDAAFVPLREAAVNEGLFAYEILVAEADGWVCGFAAYEEEELAWLYVDPACMRQGVGFALVSRVLQLLDGQSLLVEVLCGNLPARRLYEKAGFCLKETVSGVMPGNEVFSVTVWRLERQ